MRVPTVIQWVGKILPNTQSDIWGAHTDLVPTLLDAANISIPTGMSTIVLLSSIILMYGTGSVKGVDLDGLSLLPALFRPNGIRAKMFETRHQYLEDTFGINNHVGENNDFKNNDTDAHLLWKYEIGKNKSGVQSGQIHNATPKGQALIRDLRSRLFLYNRKTELVHEDDHPFGAAAVWGGRFKIVTTEKDMCIYRIFDLRLDRSEATNLLQTRRNPLQAFTLAKVMDRISSKVQSDFYPDDVPEMFDLCPSIGTNGLYTLTDQQFKVSMAKLRRYFNIQAMSKLYHCNRFKNNTQEALCTMKVIDMVVSLVSQMLVPLRRFVSNANSGHQAQVCYPLTHTTKQYFGAIPVASSIRPIEFGNISFPDFFYQWRME